MEDNFEKFLKEKIEKETNEEIRDCLKELEGIFERTKISKNEDL